MISKLLSFLNKKTKKPSFYKVVSDIESGKKRRLLEQAAILANKEQRKIYYSSNTRP